MVAAMASEAIRYKRGGPWNDGQRAFSAGKKQHENPHEPGSDDHSLWDDGWLESQFYGGWIGPQMYELESDDGLYWDGPL